MAEVVPRELTFVRCYCTGVTRERALAAIRQHGCRTVDELRELTGACGGCGSCRPELVALLASVEPAPPPDTRH